MNGVESVWDRIVKKMVKAPRGRKKECVGGLVTDRKTDGQTLTKTLTSTLTG